jgi:hypothetical protein
MQLICNKTMLLTLCFFVPSLYICVALMAVTYHSVSAHIFSLVQVEILFVFVTYHVTSMFFVNVRINYVHTSAALNPLRMNLTTTNKTDFTCQ